MDLIATLPENKHGRDLIVGDIHGAFALLIKTLVAAKFDPTKDRLISVGDLGDRGPNSPMALTFLQQPWFYAVYGNHEEMFLDVVRPDGSFHLADKHDKHNIKNGLSWIFAQKAPLLKALHEKFSALPLAIEIETPEGIAACVHAEVPEFMSWQAFKGAIDVRDNYVMQTAIWGRSRITHNVETNIDGVLHTFHGHTVIENPVRLGNCIFLDTGAVFHVLDNDPKLSLTLCDARTLEVMTGKSWLPAPTAEDEKRLFGKVLTATPAVAPPAKKNPFYKWSYK